MNAASALHGSAADDMRQFLTFKLGGEEYGVGILSVREIRGWSAVTAIAHSPPWMLGVINLRGAVVPIIDLRIKFAVGRADYNELTVVIILNVGERLTGVVVDAVADVITLSRDQIKAPPPLGAGVDTSHIIGFDTSSMRILIDVARLMADGGDIEWSGN